MLPAMLKKNTRVIWIATGIAFLITIAVVVFFIRVKGPAMFSGLVPTPSREEMYPPAPALPSTIRDSVDDLLVAHEVFLKANAPSVLAALHPGLSDVEIDKLEAAYSIKLTSDLRALYRWRNGTPQRTLIDTFPDHQFVPLEVALANRDDLRKQVQAQPVEQQRKYAVYAGHRDAWVGVIVDPAGDGHFFDPTRTEADGSFFSASLRQLITSSFRHLGTIWQESLKVKRLAYL